MVSQTVIPVGANLSLTAAPIADDDSKEGSSYKTEEKEQNSSEDNDGGDSEDEEDDAGVVENKQDDSEVKFDSESAGRGRGKKQSNRQPLKRDKAGDKNTLSIPPSKRTRQSGLKHNAPPSSVLTLDDTKEAVNDAAIRDKREEEKKEGKSSDDDDKDSAADADEGSEQDDTADTEAKDGGKKRSARGQRKHKRSPKRSGRSVEHGSTEEDNVTAEHKEQDSTGEKQSAQQDGDDEKSEEKDRTDGGSEEEKDAMAEDGEEEMASPIRRTRKRKASVAAAKTAPTKRRSRGDHDEDRQENARLHDAVSEGATLSLHSFVLNTLQCEDEGAHLQRVYTKSDGSCMLNSVLMGMNNGVHPTAEQVQALRDHLKTTIEAMTQEAWNSLEHNGHCSTPHEYTQRFLTQPDAFLDRSILHFVLQLNDAAFFSQSNDQDDHPPQQSPSTIYCITVQPLFPHAHVEESDDISVNVPSKDDMAVRVHKFEKDSESEESPTDCIVLYQLWGATVSKHVELVVEPKSDNSGPATTRFPDDHPFIMALDKRVTSKKKQIEHARQNRFVCNPLQEWTFPCLLDDFFPATSSALSQNNSISHSSLPVAQRILASVRRDLDRSDRRFLKYLVALSHVSQISNTDKREQEYSRVAHFLDEYEPCNMPIILGCILISFFIYATPQVGKWFHSQKRVTLKMLACCSAVLVRDEYLLKRLFLHLAHDKTLVKRDDIVALATKLIDEDEFLSKGGWDIDKKTYEFTFLVIHSAGETDDNAHVLKHERVWWPQSLLEQDEHWRAKVEYQVKTIRSLTIKEFGDKVRRRKGGGEELCVFITGDPQHPRWWSRDQILHHKVKQWKEKLNEYEAQREAAKENEDEKKEDAVESTEKDEQIQELLAEIERQKAAFEKERTRREKAEQALKERIEKDKEKIKKAKEALAAEKAEIAEKRKQLAKQEAKIKEWIRDHPECDTVMLVTVTGL